MDNSKIFDTNITVKTAQQKNETYKKAKDLVKILLSTIPTLENARNDLLEIIEETTDMEVKEKINHFSKAILHIIEKMLDLTKEKIKNAQPSSDKDVEQFISKNTSKNFTMRRDPMQTPFKLIEKI